MEPQADQQGAVARQLRRKIQRIEPVIAVGDIQHANTYFCLPSREAVADKEIYLPEIIARNVGIVTLV